MPPEHRVPGKQREARDLFDRPFRSAQIGASAVAAAALSIFLIAAAFAKAPSTLTFHFFSKVETFSITNAAGNPLSANAARRPGDVIQATDLNYVGNHRHHAAHWTSTDHLRCVISAVTSMGFQAVCDGQVAIGGSMLLADHVVSTFTRNAKSVPLNRGTGVYLAGLPFRGRSDTRTTPISQSRFTGPARR
jgi:hypothetical protein